VEKIKLTDGKNRNGFPSKRKDAQKFLIFY